jgi:hypothetical protein
MYVWFLMQIQTLFKIKCDIYYNCQTIQSKIVISQLSIPLVASAWCLKRWSSFWWMFVSVSFTNYLWISLQGISRWSCPLINLMLLYIFWSSLSTLSVSYLNNVKIFFKYLFLNSGLTTSSTPTLATPIFLVMRLDDSALKSSFYAFKMWVRIKNSQIARNYCVHVVLIFTRNLNINSPSLKFI